MAIAYRNRIRLPRGMVKMGVGKNSSEQTPSRINAASDEMHSHVSLEGPEQRCSEGVPGKQGRRLDGSFLAVGQPMFLSWHLPLSLDSRAIGGGRGRVRGRTRNTYIIPHSRLSMPLRAMCTGVVA